MYVNRVVPRLSTLFVARPYSSNFHFVLWLLPSIRLVRSHNYDGQPHPLPGDPDQDARSYTRVDANTVISASTKTGKLVQVATLVLSPDGRTITTTGRGVDAKGQPVNSVAVYDKQ